LENRTIILHSIGMSYTADSIRRLSFFISIWMQAEK